MKNKKHVGLILGICLVLSVVGAKSVDAATLDVCSGGTYTTIQAAINAAANGDTVSVCDGTYNENIDFLGKAITVRSENGAATTIIDGNASDNVVNFINSEGADSVLDGFTIQNGLSNYGGGIYCQWYSSPTITNCIISNNTANYSGGGIYCVMSSSPTISNCIIKDNTITGGSHYMGGGGIACEYESSPVITNCTISGNSAPGPGGGIYCYDYSSPTITNCTISGNSAGDDGGGIACHNDSSPIIANCIVSNNNALGAYADGGGIACQYNSSPTISNCTIANNTTTWYGGGICCFDFSSPVMTNCIISNNKGTVFGGGIVCESDASPTVVNCTISGNWVDGDGGGIASLGYSSPLVVNSILWGNAASGTGNEISLFQEWGPSTIDITFSDIQGGWTDTGNIDTNPLFVDSANGDYHLTGSSPCIDQGTNDSVTYPNLPADDIDGDTRPQNTDYDIGADEYVSVCTDSDGDGYAVEGGICGEIDCDDTDAGINPDACDIKNDGIDQDCDGSDRTNGQPCGVGGEVCDDGIDNDGNGKTDCADPNCMSDPVCE